MAVCRYNRQDVPYHRADLERFLFLISCTREIWILRRTARHFDCVIQAPRVILEHYRSHYNVAFDDLRLFRILLSFYMQGIHIRSKFLRNSIMMAPLFSFFMRPKIFLFTIGIRVVARIIAHVKYIYITFHDIVNIITFYVVYEIVDIGVHNFAFFVKQWHHVFIEKFNTSWICWGCTYLCISVCQTSSILRSSIAIRFSEKTFRLWKFDLASGIVSASYLLSHFEEAHVDAIAYVLHGLSNIALFISLYKFFSKSFFTNVLNFVLSSI